MSELTLVVLRSAAWHILVSIKPSYSSANATSLWIAAMRLSLLQRHVSFNGSIVAVLSESNDSVDSLFAHGRNVP